MKIIGEIFRPDPQLLYLEPFFGCNYRCPFCIHGGEHQIEAVQLGPLLFEKLKPVIRKVEQIHITGLGEPFLNPHLLNYLSYFRDKGKSYYINTNGSLIEDSHIGLMTTSKAELSISLDAGDQETYGKVRHARNWDKVISCLHKVARVKAARKSAYPLLYLTFHINSLNLMSLKRVPELARELGIGAVKFSWTLLPEAHRANSLFKNRDLVDEVVHSVSAQLTEAGIQVRNQALFTRHQRGCWALSPMAFIGANGTVAGCCSRWITVGHLDENSFEDIWNGTPRRRIVLAIISGNPEGVCNDCPQIRGADYAQSEYAFLKSKDLEEHTLAEKTKRIGGLPSLEGLGDAFRAGTKALLEADFPAAVRILADLEKRHPDFFEIKNNLAVAHYHLGSREKCRELLDATARIPHNRWLLQANRDSLQ